MRRSALIPLCFSATSVRVRSGPLLNEALRVGSSRVALGASRLGGCLSGFHLLRARLYFRQRCFGHIDYHCFHLSESVLLRESILSGKFAPSVRQKWASGPECFENAHHFRRLCLALRQLG